MPPENEILHKMSRPFRCEEYYEGDTDEKNCNTDDSLSGNYDIV